MGCLSGAADGDVTDGDDRCAVRTAFQNAHLEECIPDANDQSVEPAQWQKPFIDFYEVAFQCFLLVVTLFAINDHVLYRIVVENGSLACRRLR